MSQRIRGRILPTRAGIASDLIACKAAFDRVKIPWILIDGLVLGYVRQKDIIPGDTDLDLAVCKELSDSEWDRLYTSLREAGFHPRKKKTDFIYGRRRVKFNLWLYHREGDYYVAYPPTAPGMKYIEKAKWYDKIQLVNFLDAFYPMPTHLGDYLVCRYGSDWNEARYTHTQWRLEKFGISTGHYEPEVWLKSRCGPKGDLWPRIMRIEDKL